MEMTVFAPRCRVDPPSRSVTKQRRSAAGTAVLTSHRRPIATSFGAAIAMANVSSVRMATAIPKHLSPPP